MLLFQAANFHKSKHSSSNIIATFGFNLRSQILLLRGYVFLHFRGVNMAEPDLSLLGAARRLDPDALIKIFDQYSPALYSYALRLCNDPVLADQIVGDVFGSLLDQLVSGKGPCSNLRSYLFQAAHNLVVDEFRYTRRRAPLDVLNLFTGDEHAVPAHTHDRLLLQAVWESIRNDLTADQRHVIILRLLEGFSLRETASIVGKKVGHVKVIQNRAIAVLRRVLHGQLVETADSPSL